MKASPCCEPGCAACRDGRDVQAAASLARWDESGRLVFDTPDGRDRCCADASVLALGGASCRSSAPMALGRSMEKTASWWRAAAANSLPGRLVASFGHASRHRLKRRAVFGERRQRRSRDHRKGLQGRSMPCRMFCGSIRAVVTRCFDRFSRTKSTAFGQKLRPRDKQSLANAAQGLSFTVAIGLLRRPRRVMSGCRIRLKHSTADQAVPVARGASRSGAPSRRQAASRR